MLSSSLEVAGNVPADHHVVVELLKWDDRGVDLTVAGQNGASPNRD